MSILVLTSDTLIGTPAAGNIEYNGQFFGTDSNASRAQLQRIVRSTAVASTSGTSIDFTGIPAWVEKITVMLSGISTNGTANYLIQIGSGSVTTSGYLGAGGSTGGISNFTTGFGVAAGAASVVMHATMTITNVSGNIWLASHVGGRSDAAAVTFGGGSVTLSGVLDRVRITTANGTDAYDAGSINLLLEG
jgi:hypothetical protein